MYCCMKHVTTPIPDFTKEYYAQNGHQHIQYPVLYKEKNVTPYIMASYFLRVYSKGIDYFENNILA